MEPRKKKLSEEALSIFRKEVELQRMTDKELDEHMSRQMRDIFFRSDRPNHDEGNIEDLD